MNIKVSQKVGRRGILLITVDEEEVGEIHTTIFGPKPPIPSQIDSLQAWEDLFDTLEYQQTKRYVLKRLAERPFHTAELSKCLRERLVRGNTIDRVIGECVESGYLNDKEWVDLFIQGHLRRRHSLRLIAQKMQSRGISSSEAKEAVSQKKDPESEKESIRYLLTTRYRSRNLQNRQDREKVIASLICKGFDYQSIKEAMRVEA